MANVKLSAIAASGTNFASTDQLVMVRSAATDLLLSFAQVNAGLSLFSTSTTAQGVVPGSNGSTTNFLRGDGTWQPVSGAGLPLVGTGATVTVDTPLLNLTETWNNAAVVFNGIKAVFTATANDGLSRILDVSATGASASGSARLTLVANPSFPSNAVLSLGGNFTSGFTQAANCWQFSSGGGNSLCLGNAGLITGLGLVKAASIGWSSDNADIVDFGDTFIGREGVGILRLYNAASTTTPTGFHAYNLHTDETANFERALFDWTTQSNVLTIGVQKGATTGSSRDLQFLCAGAASANVFFVQWAGIFIQSGAYGSLTRTVALIPATGFGSGIELGSQTSLSWGNSTDAAAGGNDCGFQRVGAKVVSFTDGSAGANVNGWPQWAGEARVTADFASASSSITLQNITGLSVNVQAGRTYAFYAYLSCTDTAAAGLRAGIGGTATATNIIYDGYALDANTQKGQANSAALGGVVANTTTTSTTGIVVEIQGTITVNAAGTLTVQIAQSVSTGAAPVTVKRGSYFWVQDMP